MMFGKKLLLTGIIISLLYLSLSFSSTVHAQTVLVPSGASWKYLDNGADMGTSWRSLNFDDSTWKSGFAQLGFGDKDEPTVLTAGYITYYFRRSFNVSDASLYPALKIRLKRDDGAVVYLNGTEIFRSNMPSGSINFSTVASLSVGGDDEATFYEAAADGSLLVDGTNVLAVEVHQRTASSNDVSFDAELLGDGSGGTIPRITRGPYLQRGSEFTVNILWRTNIPTNSRVRYSRNTSLNLIKDDTTLTTEHNVQLTGLASNLQYFYSVGTTTQTLATGPDYYFYAMPRNEHPIYTRIWVVGDSGTGTANARAVRDAFYNFNGGKYTNVFLMLGDNAYESGTDAEYQSTLFDIYPKTLRQTLLWPAIGDRDTDQSSSPPADIPYYKIFDLPKNGESHGRASGTEDYYSFTQGNIHFVCLDSMTSNTSPGSPMLTWLEDDLARQDNPWIIAYWHHPPYSKGSHDSDTEARLAAMRQNVLPILERHGVDLVLGAHSNSYERSYLLDGHYGSSGTLSSSMVLDSGNGRVTGDGPYVKQQYVGNSGTVYATAGSSGKVESAPLNHPAMFIGLNNLGSMVIDINFNRLDAWFVKADGVVGDHFRLVKQNSPPVVSITQPTNGAEFDNVSQIVIKANVQDEGIRRVRFFAGTTHIDTVYEPPYEIVWPHPPVGTFRITARAEDKLMLSTTSAPVEITINSSH